MGAAQPSPELTASLLARESERFERLHPRSRELHESSKGELRWRRSAPRPRAELAG